MSESKHIAAVYFSASTPGALFAKAAEWCNANDGRYEIEAVQFEENIHGVAPDERYDLSLYFEPRK
ncbi:hypothetical protein [Catenuloplanes atrovinosus]|uniref:Uncharacterized protein n=1 Tax=Catenuloplanes atrovinosus TaxID=137266 RepID=A0AAE3YUW3_9ACTN|nr:hypothetical protein [Catenuloplanes atrovinosus]MDR7278391.1 hypothetical protein [Catenuloplanes atrovinosus]